MVLRVIPGTLSKVVVDIVRKQLVFDIIRNTTSMEHISLQWNPYTNADVDGCNIRVSIIKVGFVRGSTIALSRKENFHYESNHIGSDPHTT